MSQKIIAFREEQDHLIHKDDIDISTARTIYEQFGSKIKILEPGFSRPDHYLLRSLGYVGYFPIDDEVTLKIEPKVPLSTIFGMLEYAYKLESFKMLEGHIGVEAIEDIYERLALILAKQVLDRARKGLYRDYIEKDGSLTHLRGRCNILKSYSNSMRGGVRLECEYEENTADLEDNRILAWTLYRVPKLPFKRDDIRRKVKQAYRSLSSAVEITSVDAKACVGRCYHRLNEDYEPMHGLCRFFLEHCGPGMEVGDRDFIPFILSMPYLFQSFVANWLNQHLPTGLRIEQQYKTCFDDEGRFSFDIDLVLMEVGTERVLAVLDTKYKMGAKPSSDDIAQIVAYAVHMNTQNGFLIYPSVDTTAVELPLGKDISINVRSLVFDLSSDLEAAGTVMLDKLLACLNYI